MPSIIIVEKNGTIRRATATSKTLNVPELYKKCGFKSEEGFNCAHTWTIEFNAIEYKLQVYGKIKGKAGSENKYEFPPPIENVLFFGSCAIINVVNEEITDMSTNDFNDIMEYLQGGYSDIENSENDDDDDDLEESTLPKTKEGYVKDDFIVDDDDDDDCSSSSEEPVKKTKSVKNVKTVKPTKEKPIKSEKPDKLLQIIKKKPVKPEPIVTANVFKFLDELVEEDYI
jgi:hypothetical protein